MNFVRVTIRDKPVKVAGGGSKADIARALLEEGYTVSEISKAVPMAYSQVHSIAAKIKGEKSATIEQARERHRDYNKANSIPDPVVVRRHETVKATRAAQAAVDRIIKRERGNEAAGRPAGPKAKARPRGLQVGSLPHDVDVSPCANCGYDLVVRKGPYGFMLVHVNATAEEYLATIQFCLGVPERLVKAKVR